MAAAEDYCQGPGAGDGSNAVAEIILGLLQVGVLRGDGSVVKIGDLFVNGQRSERRSHCRWTGSCALPATIAENPLVRGIADDGDGARASTWCIKRADDAMPPSMVVAWPIVSAGPWFRRLI